MSASTSSAGGDDCVNLNIGGTLFKTTLSTVRRDPESMLCRLFSDDWLKRSVPSGECSLSSSPSEAFIDRDGTHFRYILNFLRDGNEAKLPTSAGFLAELKAEAEYYQVHGLVDLINVRLSEFVAPAQPIASLFATGQSVRWQTEACESFWPALFDFIRLDEIRNASSLSVIKDVKPPSYDANYVWVKLCCLSCGIDATITVDRRRIEYIGLFRQTGRALIAEMKQMTGKIAAVMENCVVVEWNFRLLLNGGSYKMHLPKSALEVV